MSYSKEIILNKIKTRIHSSSNLNNTPCTNENDYSNLYVKNNDNLIDAFKNKFIALLGNFSIFENEHTATNFIQKLCKEKKWQSMFCGEDNLKNTLQLNAISINQTNDLSSCDFSITSCEYLVARTGSIVLSSSINHGRTASIYAPVHVCVAYTHQIVENELSVFNQFEKKTRFPSFLCFATGPSRTADIEKTLIVGVHGPKEVYCLLIKN